MNEILLSAGDNAIMHVLNDGGIDMRNKLKKTALWMIICTLTVLLTACGGPETTYKRAQELLSKGKFVEAAEKFESIGSYEDASTLTMYSKACALCEEGQYDAGLAAFAMLGDFKDSAYRIIYYQALSMEKSAKEDNWKMLAEAQALHKTIPVFLDSAQRITAIDGRIEKAKDAQYKNAIALGESGRYLEAETAFRDLTDFKDSAKYVTYYEIREYEASVASSADQDAVLSAANRYQGMGNFADCRKRQANLIAKAEEIVSEKYEKVAALVEEGRYAEAEQTLAAFGKFGNHLVAENYYAIAEKYLDENRLDEAISAFGKCRDYKDARKRIAYLGVRKDEEALKQTQDTSEIMAVAEKYAEMGDYLDCADRFAKLKNQATAILDDKYETALQMRDEGNYGEAYKIFVGLGEYRDSLLNAASILKEHPKTPYQIAGVGDYVTMGVCEQDNETENGKEAIEWLILAKENERILVISKYLLAAKSFHSDWGYAITWENCTLRSWLNGEFMNEAFTPEEQAIILSTTVTAEKNPKYDAYEGNNTHDKLFLLSINEVKEYFDRDADPRCKTTPYAFYTSGSITGYRPDYDLWWLRTSGSPFRNHSSAVVVSDDGEILLHGAPVDNHLYFVRPAMWIDTGE